MLFKSFDINLDDVIIDGNQVIKRPDYFSISQWLGFWSFANTGKFSFEQEVLDRFDETFRRNEQEHEQELNKLENDLKLEFNDRICSINKLLNESIDSISLLENHLYGMEYKLD